MLSDSGEAQSQESIQDKISQCKFPVSSGNFQCPPESIQCPITLERPEEGVFVKIQIVRQYAAYLILMHFLV